MILEVMQMAIKYECDKCGKIYDWYGTVNRFKEYDDASFAEQQRMGKEDLAAGRRYGRGAQWYPTNFIALGMFEPPNENLGSNNGCMSADIGYNGTDDADKTDISRYKEYAHRNNSMIFLCRDCMRDFLKSLRIDVFGQ
jgi:hypothetical protein